MKEEITALVPDFYDWPLRWMEIDDDVAYGQNILKCFEPFVFEIATGNLSKKTKKKHIDNLWLAGGELIRKVSNDEIYELDPKELILEGTSENFHSA